VAGANRQERTQRALGVRAKQHEQGAFERVLVDLLGDLEIGSSFDIVNYRGPNLRTTVTEPPLDGVSRRQAVRGAGFDPRRRSHLRLGGKQLEAVAGARPEARICGTE